MSNPLLLEVAAEIDTNQTSFIGGREGGRSDGASRYRLALRARHVCPPHIF